MSRTATVERNTKETKIKINFNIDGTGTCKSETGVGFFDHMLDGFARHGLFDLDVKVDGDLFVDLFCGGLDVSLNVKSEKKICNDLEPHIIDFYTNIQKLSGEEVHNKLMEIVKQCHIGKCRWI